MVKPLPTRRRSFRPITLPPITSAEMEDLYGFVLRTGFNYLCHAHTMKQFAIAVSLVPTSIMSKSRTDYLDVVNRQLMEAEEFHKNHQWRVLNDKTGLGIKADSPEAAALFNEIELDRFGCWVAQYALEEWRQKR